MPPACDHLLLSLRAHTTTTTGGNGGVVRTTIIAAVTVVIVAAVLFIVAVNVEWKEQTRITDVKVKKWMKYHGTSVAYEERGKIWFERDGKKIYYKERR